MDTSKANRAAWNEEVARGNVWTRPVTREDIDKARGGEPRIQILPQRYLEGKWLEAVEGKVLALASGGGQQGPLLAAAGFDVTVTDLSEKQLENDRKVATRENLPLRTIQMDMSDPFPFASGFFDTIFNPVSINFVRDPYAVYSECSRVLRKGGVLITAFANPAMYIFDVKKLEKGKMKIRYTLPFSTSEALNEREKEKLIAQKDTFEYSHTFSSLFGALSESGFLIKDIITSGSEFEPIDSFLQDCYLAVLAVKA